VLSSHGEEKENQKQTPVASLLVATKVATHQFVVIHTAPPNKQKSQSRLLLWLWLLLRRLPLRVPGRRPGR
jgi:hypothetical protein